MNYNDINKLNEELDEIINEDIINEMSKAFSYKDKGIDVCVWVEGPMRTDNQYFKYYDNMFYDNATKVARIRIDRNKYVGGQHREKNKKKWILSDKEKNELVQILQQPSERYPKYTRWQEVLMTYNYDNFNITPENTMLGKIDDSQRNPNMPKYIKPFPIDYPMPDYTKLED